MLRGVKSEKRAKVKKLLEECFNLLNLDNEVIEIYCNLYHRLKGGRILIPDADLLIATTAISQGITLKTEDEHFKRLEG